METANKFYRRRVKNIPAIAFSMWRLGTQATLLYLLALRTAGCVPIFIFPPELSLCDPPAVEGPSATAIIVRPRQFCGCWPTHYISIDGARVARLRPGQHTAITVSQGRHTLGTTWHVGEPMVLGLDFYPYDKATSLKFKSGRTYFFFLRVRCFARKETDRVDLLALEKLPEHVHVDPKHFVPPGPRCH